LSVKLLPHQSKIISAIENLKDKEFFFFVGGYGCGKSSSLAFTILYLAQKYQGHNVTMGIGSSTITLIRKTVVGELLKYLIEYGIEYTDSKTDNIITIGTVRFLLIATSQPQEIYGHNLSCFICDELDELNQEKGIEAFQAINDRTRVKFPDGRIPFGVFATTAQGYKATYAILEGLKEKGAKYCLIRGKSADNPYLPKEYIERLYSIYNRNEQMAYLEGHFVNLTTGCVYPEFDQTKHVVEPFIYDKDVIVYIGQDLNSGYSKATCVIKKDKTFYVVKDFSFNKIGEAPHIIRGYFPENTIYWFPDASSKEIMAGYAEEIRSANINLRMNSFNPSIIERVFIVNKLLKFDKLKVFDNCKELIMALKVHQYDKNGVPEKGGEKSPDHINDALCYCIFRLVKGDPDFIQFADMGRKPK
jgi:phage terminase large subunit